MKKIILILIATLFLSCGQIDSIMNYFAELSVNTEEGSTQTQFVFEVKTNDILTGIYANGELISNTRSVSYRFNPGEYLISVETENGAYDELSITVNELVPESIVYETRFIINVTNDNSIDTPMELNYPTLIYDGIEYNLETMTPNVNGVPVKTVYTNTERLVYIDITCSWGVNSYIFRNAENWAVHLDFLREDLNIENMQSLISFVHYVEPEETLDSFLFNLTGNEGAPDRLELTDDSYLINDVETSFVDAVGTQVGNVKTINLYLVIGSGDDFILRNINLIKFFGYDSVDMTKEEVLQTIDILDRYPEEDLLDIVYDYWPENPVLEELGYFN